MDEKSYTIRLPKRWVRTALVVLVTALIVAPLTAIAAHSFTDVPDDNTFHSDIAWLADNDVTRGCNPPTNSLFCPDDDVTREQMSAFMRRLAQTFGGVEDDATNSEDITSSDSVELLSVTVTPKAGARVLLNAHVTLTKTEAGAGLYPVQIHRGDCDGTAVALAAWGADDSNFEAGTVSLTGLDTVSSDTTYTLCANKFVLGAPPPDVTASLRGLTATWSPTG